MEKTMVLYEAMTDARFPADELVLLPLEGEPNRDLPIPYLSFGDDDEDEEEDDDLEEEGDFGDLDDDLNDDFDEDDDDEDDYDDDEDDYDDDYEDDEDYDDFDE
jgi:hypothetical protein